MWHDFLNVLWRPSENGPQTLRWVVGWMAAILAGWTVFYTIRHAKKPPGNKRTAVVLLLLWTLLPPIFFWFDYFVIWPNELKLPDPSFAKLEEFKYGQELSRNVWLAFVAVVATVLLKEEKKAKGRE